MTKKTDENAPVLYNQFDAMNQLVNLNELMEKAALDSQMYFSTMSADVLRKGAISTGSLALDLTLGGGHPPGTFTYFFGKSGSGKSTVMYQSIKDPIERSIPVVFYDFEASTDPSYLSHLGIDFATLQGIQDKSGKWKVPRRLHYSRPNMVEQAFNHMHSWMAELPWKVMMVDSGEARFFLIDKSLYGKHRLTWNFINQGLKEKKIFEVADGSPQTIFVLDSINAMTPKALEEDGNDQSPALLARALSKGLNRIKSVLGDKMVNLVATNVIKINPMAKFGCLHADTMVPFVDGRSHSMREIVDNKIEGEVWSFDQEMKRIVPARIEDWFYNGEVAKPSDFVTITSGAVDTANGVSSFTCTRNHKVLTVSGWKPAADCEEGDVLVTKYTSLLNGSLRAFVLGTAIGDCTISGSHGAMPGLRFQDKNNPAYVEWKISKLADYFNFRPIDTARGKVFLSESRHEFALLKRKIGKRDPTQILDQLDDLSLAVWFMDDGCGVVDNSNYRGVLSVKRLKGDFEKLDSIRQFFKNLGIESRINLSDGSFSFNKDGFQELTRRICRFVPPCMQYKLPPDFREKYEDFELNCTPTVETEYVPVWSVRDGSERKFRQRGKYDIKVQGTHNYLVGNKDNGVVVHNSPESEPGGSTVETGPDIKVHLNVNRAMSKMIEEPSVEGGGAIDRYLLGTATIRKNKMGPVFRKTDYRLWIDEAGEPRGGFDPVFDMHTFLTETQQIEDKKIDGKPHFRIKIAGFDDVDFTVQTFKEFVLTNSRYEQLYETARDQLRTYKAQEMYFETVKDRKTVVAKKAKKGFGSAVGKEALNDDAQDDQDEPSSVIDL